MDRLTRKFSDGTPFIPNEVLATIGLKGIAEKITEYEDLGITPEQVREIDILYREKCEEVAKYKALEERLENMFGRKFPLETVVDDLELALTEPDSHIL